MRLVSNCLFRISNSIIIIIIIIITIILLLILVYISVEVNIPVFTVMPGALSFIMAQMRGVG